MQHNTQNLTMKKYQNSHSSCNLSIFIKQNNGQFEVIFRASDTDSFWQALSRFKRILHENFRTYDSRNRLWGVSFHAEDKLCQWVAEMQSKLSAQVTPAASWRRQPKQIQATNPAIKFIKNHIQGDTQL
jgi:hypothetical protein